MTPSGETGDREGSRLRFARALHRHGVRNAKGWLDDDFVGLSQTDVAAAIQLSRPTVSSLVGDAAGLLRGRRSELLLNPETCGHAVGIEFGQTHHRVALADVHGQRYAPKTPDFYETPAGKEPASFSLEWAARQVEALLSEAELDVANIWAVGVSLPGAVNTRTRRLQVVPRGLDRSWEVADLRLLEEIGLPEPTVESDYNASALTEHLWGSMGERRHALYVKVSQRCACSLLIDHRIYRGADGLAGGLGRTVVDLKGAHEWELVEDVFSLRAISDMGYPVANAAELMKRAQGDQDLRELLRRGAHALGVALAPIIDALNPESVVIGGALGTASLGWIGTDLIEGINSIGTSPARSIISERLTAGAFASATAIRGAMASALLAGVPIRIAHTMEK